ncbi:YegS/Rv2252/BmrU family lipid kinase [Nocardioides mangrovicus]|uniref:YegS/Rv2252/BmrU family lipid kinase n=1 Tax=Nocardioides mangrovicus TaxID=2478913 RepID=A0A3L8P1I3_9ACTN|nr:YegS/Rv2252/BmrU family lipid kinase [Nocardioides mangrovicus]RLV48693.1 YegS/Rv2252/BmrU family lipid kinase [Nocardioides mangrovicus]
MPSDDVVLLVNPTSGKGAGARAARLVLPRLQASGREVQAVAGRDADDALDIVREVVAAGVGTLAVCGGDGLVHTAVQALAGSSTRLGLIPAGTGNDVARMLGVPRRDPLAAADVLLAGRERALDLARVGATYFVTVMAAGFDAVVNERANAMRWPRGQARYSLATLAELRVLAPISYTLDLDGPEVSGEVHTDATLVAVGNGPSFGGGLRITEGAEPDDGLLDVVVVAPMGRRELVRTYPQLFRGTHVHHPGYVRHRVRRVTVAAPGVVAYADGERIGALPLTVEVAPGALRVLVP